MPKTVEEGLKMKLEKKDEEGFVAAFASLRFIDSAEYLLCAAFISGFAFGSLIRSSPYWAMGALLVFFVTFFLLRRMVAFYFRRREGRE